ncbi:hypothetical protein QJV14_08445 [Listeria cossartiae subsp. cayugensis]|uniref:Lmo2079 family surface lipoprotein n=1 Tax=Listeria cossartiae TaxID=2838249 RepID=UPI0028801A4D|nr:hypothetical protein [Listeria cossartiae]MDT0003585.1 hypothetical protein [Listeria cossartiae subsp. cayugensis]MDT0019979.1 hypothetical protein [Listeria cossartiae subsp. cayugensis]MDT0036859.1 hypothetical protein [Listeria cossartiae subsp. cayugensis]MDT0041730.1 hypothetical protein [Listeria cossartiae subsp. cayugensis]MDT0047081.1 hypothetical protein [Listeria cossartiae subsp. cayugensis]
MKKGILLSILLVLALVISACGESAEEKAAKTPQGKFIQTLKNGKNAPDKSTYTTTMGVTDIQIPNDDSSSQMIGILKDIKLSVTTSTDKKANKTETKANIKSTNNMLPFSMDFSVLSDLESGNSYIPLKSIVKPDASLLSFLDQATGGMWSKIDTEMPGLKDKYISTEELTSLLTDGTEVKIDEKAYEGARKNINEKITKLSEDYFQGLEKDRFKEAEDGTITVSLKKEDVVKLLTELRELMNEEAVKADFKVMTESQGSDQVKDFDTQYSELLTGLKTAADKLLDDKKLMINFDIAVKPGKNSTLDTLTISGKVEDTLNNTNPESISFKLETKAEKFVPISDFPTKEQILSKEELTLIISDFARQMYINSGVY